jgi:ligand-binding SRPBCC domain-containing protein
MKAATAPTITADLQNRGEYVLRAECTIPAPVDEVFAFFSDAFQLEALTPPWMKFSVLTPAPIEMRSGVLIDYQLRVRRIPLRWQSEITVWEPGRRFVDVQRRGPYRYWRHEHLFEPTPHGTQVIDRVEYAVPGGDLVHRLLVRRDLLEIFAYRQKMLVELFANRLAASA